MRADLALSFLGGEKRLPGVFSTSQANPPKPRSWLSGLSETSAWSVRPFQTISSPVAARTSASAAAFSSWSDMPTLKCQSHGPVLICHALLKFVADDSLLIQAILKNYLRR